MLDTMISDNRSSKYKALARWPREELRTGLVRDSTSSTHRIHACASCGGSNAQYAVVFSLPKQHAVIAAARCAVQGADRMTLCSLAVCLQAAAAAAAEAQDDSEEEGGRAAAAAAAIKESYDYLLSMAIYSLTWEKVQVRCHGLLCCVSRCACACKLQGCQTCLVFGQLATNA
jgi:hypothetical protein